MTTHDPRPTTHDTHMTPNVIEHVKVSELPKRWRAQITATEDARVTVLIEPEPAASAATEEDRDDPLFGMWRDRAEMADVQAYVRKLHAPRFFDPRVLD